MDSSRCVVLVPVANFIEPECADALRELEHRGYPVRRVRGYSQIDVGRGQMASDALADGFDELMWIDSDVAFRPDDVERLRAHGLPIAAGLYARKNRRGLACSFLPGVESAVFGPDGRVFEVLYVGFGFVHTRRAVYDAVRESFALPECNQRFGKRFVPYFTPMYVPDPPGHWYLGEDYAFCERARRTGIQIMADSTIRLWHIGRYAFTWEDVKVEGQ
jgi:hypothetical protein